MSTSAIERRRLALLRTARNYLFVTVLTALFGFGYERFSFGVYSDCMLYAFAAPLLLGALPAVLLALRSGAWLPETRVRGFWRAGTATLAVGCVFKGVLDIYGTESGFTAVYWVVGFGLLGLAAALWGAAGLRRATARRKSEAKASETIL